MATHSQVRTFARLLESIWLAALPRIRKFLWLSAGMFSAATFAMAMVGVVLYGRMDAVATSFLAWTVSAALFGLASIFRFVPDAALVFSLRSDEVLLRNEPSRPPWSGRCGCSGAWFSR